MNQKKARRTLLAAAAVLLLFCLWYTAPRTAEQLFPEFSWEDVTSVAGAYDRHKAPDHPALAPVGICGTTESIPIESEDGQAILALLRDVKYRRSLWNLIPHNGTRFHANRPGDLSIYARFYVDTPPRYLTVYFEYEDQHLVYIAEKRYTCSARGNEELARQLYELFQPYATEEVIK